MGEEIQELGQEQDQQPQAQPSYSNLSEALKAVQRLEHETTQAPVEPEQPEAQQPEQTTVQPSANVQEPGTSVDSIGGPADVQPDTTGQSSVETQPQAGQGDALPEIDRQSIVDRITYQAINNVNQNFVDKGIKEFTIGDLYKRDENTGAVTFINPDDPNRPFQSRAEAQTWIDAMNSQIMKEKQRQVVLERNNLAQTMAPMLRLVDFIPTYNMMNESQRNIFDQIISPYAVSQGGKVIGYNCDLNVAAQQAASIAATYGNAQATQQEQTTTVQPSSPALDMKSKQGAAASDAPPKNIQEAFKRVQEQEAQKRKKN